MIDDDTYLSSQNLFNFLNQYDPNVPYYFGFAHTATGCDNVWDMKKSILFAHGGSGIVLSRGTLKKMDSHWDKCIERYKNCWAGDVRVSLCLRDLNIFLTDNRNFHSEPPNENVYFSDACARPITFHHLLPHQTQALYNIETNSEVFNLAAVLNTFRIPNISFGTIRRGSDYKAVYAPDLNHCVVLCQYENECVSWVYDLGVCWLKNSIPGVDQKKNSTSGIVFEHFKCIVDPSNPFEIGM
ncbi:hypothetical protein BC833DRAFT_603807 [Globomyces pollinis-pini]|nr:hypothetical protein BC833DRAFT_603807 [Globomyces pollinis-pini]